MAKELIISANVYEKKVALIEEGVVTEFYVERRDENQGVVGNVYKGKVMKVLPGMQSAFVDIGLERDAFLYVADFKDFEEDEDIDFNEEGAATQQQKRPDERKGDRRDRGRPEPVDKRISEPPIPAVDAAELEDVVEQLAEIATEKVIEPPPVEDLEGEGLEPATTTPEFIPVQEAKVDEVTPTFVKEEIPEEVVRVGDLISGHATDFSIERITDEDIVRTEPAQEVVETEKGKRSRSRKKGKIEEEEKKSKKAKPPSKKPDVVEPPVVEAKVEDGKAVKKTAKSAAKKPARKKKGAGSETSDAASQNVLAATGFERIVDEERPSEASETASRPQVMEGEKPVEKVFQPEPEPEWKVGSFRSEKIEKNEFERIEDAAASNTESLDNRSSFKHISDVIPENILEGTTSPQQVIGDETEDDREASVRDFGSRSEMAIRRGRGRRKDRRPHPKSMRQPVGESATEDGDAATVAEEKPEGFDGDKPMRAEPRRKPERGGAPTITDLLREGQEVIVQIAKEPIAKKGARITSHIALPGRFLVYMPTVNHIGVSRKIPIDAERVRLKRTVTALRDRENAPGGFIARTACSGISEQLLHDDMRYLIRTWNDIRKKSDRSKPPTLVHRDLDLIQRILRDQLTDEFSVIRVDNEIEYARIVEFVNRVQPRLVNRVKLYTGNQPILEKYNVQPEIDKAVKPRVWLKSGGYIVINQTEALVAIDVNTGKFVGKSDRLEDTITKTNLEAAKEVVRQIRLRDLGGIIVVDFIDMEERKNRQKVMQTLQEELANDRSPSKILSINDFGLLAITRKRVKQSLERTLCSPCPYCQGGGMVKSAQTMCYEILEQAKAISEQVMGSTDIMLRVSPIVAEALHTSEQAVFEEIEANFGSPITIEADPNLHQEQYDFAIA
ncbi:MAG: Rne/Rng family ribonuclease [Acidobacteriota bacterium]